MTGVQTCALPISTYTATYTEKAIIKEKRTATVNDFVFTPPSDLTYDGNGKSATVSKKEGTDNLIFKTEYYDDKGNKFTDGTFPSEPGTYFVKVKVFEEGDFKEGILENNEWKFVITPCDYAVSLIANGGTFKGEELTGYTYTVGAALPTADDIERTGYTFEGSSFL